MKLTFQSTLPVRGATWHHLLLAQARAISIHAPRAGSDRTLRPASPKQFRFQSTLPVRGATSRSRGSAAASLDFNPRSPCGERRDQTPAAQLPWQISIHAPRAGSDLTLFVQWCMGKKFQSTLPVRGATPVRRPLRSRSEFQSTLPVRGATVKIRIFIRIFK